MRHALVFGFFGFSAIFEKKSEKVLTKPPLSTIIIKLSVMTKPHSVCFADAYRDGVVLKRPKRRPC